MLIWGILGLAALLAVVGIWLHHLFEGEWLPSDLWREWDLSRRDLAALDRRWQGAERSDLVVSLTTTPSRIGLLAPTLKSLLDQTRPPARIVLNVPAFSLREQVPYVVPDGLDRLAAVQIRRVAEDLGPATKLIPGVQSEPPDTALVVVDDDRIYPRRFLEVFEQATQRWPDRALTMAGWVAPRDLIDRMTTIRSNLFMAPPAPIRGPRLRAPRQVDVFQGVMGYLVRPRFFDAAALADFSEHPPEVRFVDDVRSSALCRAEIWAIPCPSLSFVPRAQARLLQKTRLGLINRVPGESHNRNNTIALQFFADAWSVGGPR